MSKMSIRPLGDNVVIKRTEAKDMSDGGIALPENAQEKPQRGVVLAVGDGRMLDNGSRGDMQVKVNDEVIFAAYAGSQVEIDSEEYLVMHETDILGVVE